MRTLKHSLSGRSIQAVLCLCAIVIVSQRPARAQMSSLKAYSPYTMYGLGDLAVGGSAQYRPMGGIGVGVRDPYSFNYRNPAAMSAIPRQSAIFNFAGEGQNFYDKNDISTTSYNSFSMHDLGLAVPLGKGVGLHVKSDNNPALRKELCKIADSRGIPYQISLGRFVHGGTDASPMQTGGGGTATANVSIPCRYMHSPVEICHKRDIEGALSLLCATIREIGERGLDCFIPF